MEEEISGYDSGVASHGFGEEDACYGRTARRGRAVVPCQEREGVGGERLGDRSYRCGSGLLTDD